MATQTRVMRSRLNVGDEGGSTAEFMLNKETGVITTGDVQNRQMWLAILPKLTREEPPKCLAVAQGTGLRESLSRAVFRKRCRVLGWFVMG